MARSHARINAAIWRDPDFTALSADAQRLYLLLLSQPNLSLVGVIDFMPARWAKLAPDTTTETVTEAVEHLARARFVIVDGDELLIRTFVVHDLTRLNVNVVKGVWSAWNAVASPLLRSSIVHSLPAEVWDEKRVTPPDAALQMRRSDPMKQTVTTDRPNGTSLRTVPTSLVPSPSTLNPPPPSVPTGRVPDEVWTEYASRALRLEKGSIRQPSAWKAATEARARREERERAERLWREFDLNPSQLADVLLSPSAPQWLNHCRRKEVSA